jgi:hypothetical protein
MPAKKMITENNLPGGSTRGAAGDDLGTRIDTVENLLGKTMKDVGHIQLQLNRFSLVLDRLPRRCLLLLRS